MRSLRVNERSVIDEKVAWYIPLILVFFAGAMGMLVGSLVGKVATPVIAIASLIFLAFIFISLLMTWSINRNLVVIKDELAKESWEKQYIAFTMLINELEENLEARSFSQTSKEAFESLRYDFMLFPPLIYDSLVEFYKRLESFREASDEDFKKAIRDEMNLTNLIYNLHEYRLMIRKQFSYL